MISKGAISVGGNLKADYYNMKIAMWEPVVEEWSCQFIVEFPVNSGQKYIGKVKPTRLMFQ